MVSGTRLIWHVNKTGEGEQNCKQKNPRIIRKQPNDECSQNYVYYVKYVSTQKSIKTEVRGNLKRALLKNALLRKIKSGVQELSGTRIVQRLREPDQLFVRNSTHCEHQNVSHDKPSSDRIIIEAQTNDQVNKLEWSQSVQEKLTSLVLVPARDKSLSVNDPKYFGFL